MGLGTAIMGCKEDGKVRVKDAVEVSHPTEPLPPTPPRGALCVGVSSPNLFCTPSRHYLCERAMLLIYMCVYGPRAIPVGLRNKPNPTSTAVGDPEHFFTPRRWHYEQQRLP